MKTLYIIRHAKSEWEDSSLPDFDRKLSNRGDHDTALMSNLLFAKDVTVEKIISSPAKRARTTGKIFANRFGINKNEIQLEKKMYEASQKTLLEIIHQIDDAVSSVMLFGHNPGLTSLVNYLGANIDNFPTCAIAAFEFDVDTWKDAEVGNFLFYEFPKKYEKEE